MEIQKNVSLREFSTFKIGGEARFFCSVTTKEELLEALVVARKEEVPVFILGGGSNVLVSDDGFSGLVIKMDFRGIEFLDKGTTVEAIASAGEPWDAFVAQVVEKNLRGLENLSGIPGTVGAAPVQNIGAYGVEVKDSILWVEVLNTKTLKTEVLENEACQFDYRNSFFKTKKGKHLIITRVCFSLSKKRPLKTDYKDLTDYFFSKDVTPTLKGVRKAVLEIRGRKFPDLSKIGTAGSFFKNPILSKHQFKALMRMYPDMPYFVQPYGKVKVPLGWILEYVCGVKGKRVGDVASFEKQALVLVNFGSASAYEVSTFAHEIIRNVKEKTGIDVEWEVQWVE